METLIFKIIGFTKFPNDPNGEDDNDCKAILENGTEIIVDPFVGCAYKYEAREHLLGKWWKAEGHYHSSGVFLPREGGFHLVDKQD